MRKKRSVTQLMCHESCDERKTFVECAETNKTHELVVRSKREKYASVSRVRYVWRGMISLFVIVWIIWFHSEKRDGLLLRKSTINVSLFDWCMISCTSLRSNSLRLFSSSCSTSTRDISSILKFPLSSIVISSATSTPVLFFRRGAWSSLWTCQVLWRITFDGRRKYFQLFRYNIHCVRWRMICDLLNDFLNVISCWSVDTEMIDGNDDT